MDELIMDELNVPSDSENQGDSEITPFLVGGAGCLGPGAACIGFGLACGGGCFGAGCGVACGVLG